MPKRIMLSEMIQHKTSAIMDRMGKRRSECVLTLDVPNRRDNPTDKSSKTAGW